ncbi:hypothetical protein AURANDRAFT_68471 [Aureococcus anophagefferens]|uniref:Uncharacterized protein n=1 Tax=Aureococcus anophagefferens TaxID=44056 RepID=F0YPS1_AURAN|nr:hypothetical protein AURANDRAFT_68471 [Aureococcus anophagefferens]EGB02888.1 hypothetical protein AURANDRAFT_68471 [Aureococcus anophagefferens]|eukprot:XP_009042414.1 hypothetical protein AURANDRAFT_68471 [Aureococcus anophagefferens]
MTAQAMIPPPPPDDSGRVPAAALDSGDDASVSDRSASPPALDRFGCEVCDETPDNFTAPGYPTVAEEKLFRRRENRSCDAPTRHSLGKRRRAAEDDLAAPPRKASPPIAHPRAAPARDAGDDAAADAAPRPSLGDGDVAPAAPAALVAAFGDVADDAAPEARAAAALAACWRGLEFLGGLGASEPVLAGFGADLCLTFHDVAATAPDPLRALALYHVERLAQRWKGAHEAALDVAQIEPVEVCDLLAGVVAVARAGAAHASLKMECKAVADRVVGARGRRRAADAFLSADVLGKPIGDVNDSRRRAGRCRAATNAVLCASLAERAEVPVGADEAEVWAWLDPLRPYAPYEAMGWEDWLDQLTLAVTLVAVASNDCALRLPPSLLPAEYALVADPATLRRCVKKRDVHLVGDVATCLRSHEGAATGSEFSVARLQMSALRNIGDCNEAIGDAAIALKYARAHVNMGERDTDRTVVADSRKRLISAYAQLANQYTAEEEDFLQVEQQEVLDLERLRNLHPDQLDRFEESPYWIAANARNLARLQLEKYRDAVNVHFAKPETPTNNHGGASPTRFPELKNQASIRNFA